MSGKKKADAAGKTTEDSYCNHCGKKLKAGRIVGLEYNMATDTWHPQPTKQDDGSWKGSVPEGDSQGCFDFGPACAKKVLAGAHPKKWGAV